MVVFSCSRSCIHDIGGDADFPRSVYCKIPSWICSRSECLVVGAEEHAGSVREGDAAIVIDGDGGGHPGGVGVRVVIDSASPAGVGQVAVYRPGQPGDSSAGAIAPVVILHLELDSLNACHADLLAVCVTRTGEDF